MNRFLLSVATLSALALAAPAAAQYAAPYRDSRALVEHRIRQLELRIDASVRNGTLSRLEAAHLRGELWRLRRLETDYGHNGIDPWEQKDLRSRIAELGRRVGAADRYAGYGARDHRGGWDRDEWDPGAWDRDAGEDYFGREAGDQRGYGYGEDGDEDYRSDDGRDVDPRFDRNGDGWDDRDADRDGNPDEDGYDPIDDQWDFGGDADPDSGVGEDPDDRDDGSPYYRSR